MFRIVVAIIFSLSLLNITFASEPIGGWGSIVEADNTTTYKLSRDFINQAAPNQYNDEQKWGLMAGALLCYYNKFPLDTLEIFGKNSDYTKKEIARSLEKSWGVEDRASYIDTVESLLKDGHRRSFEQYGQEVKTIPDIAYIPLCKNYLEEYGDFSKLYLLRNYYPKLKAGILGWDMSRIIYLSRVSYTLGYISEEDAWKYIYKAATTIQKNFNNWQDLWESYLIGRNYWSYSSSLMSNEIFVNLIDCLNALEGGTKFNLDWSLELTEKGMCAKPQKQKVDSNVVAKEFRLSEKINIEDLKGKYKHIVCVPDDCDDLEKAVLNAAEGTCVFIKPGKYILKDTLKIDSGIEILGQDRDTVILTVQKLNKRVISIVQCENVSIKNLTVKQTKFDYTNTQDLLIKITATRSCNLEKLRISKGINGAININNSYVKIKDCEMDAENYAISSVLGQITIENCVMAGKGTAGIIYSLPLKLIIKNSYIANKKTGIFGNPSNNDGLISDILITGCIIENNEEGIKTDSSKSSSIEENIIANNLYGIVASRSNDLNIVKNIATGNGFTTINIQDTTGKINVLNNQLLYNGQTAIRVQHVIMSKDIDISQNIIHGNNGYGLDIYSIGYKANPPQKNRLCQITENTFSDNGLCGLKTKKCEYLLATQNTFKDNWAIGVEYGGEGVLKGNNFIDNAAWPIVMKENEKLSDSHNNLQGNYRGDKIHIQTTLKYGRPLDEYFEMVETIKNSD